MTAIQLSRKLSQLSDSLKDTNRLILRLAKLTFQPGSEPLEGEGSVRLELSQDIHDSLKQFEEDLELLRQDAEDLLAGGETSGTSRSADGERERERARLDAQLARLGEDLRHSRSSFRKAQLSAKKASEAAKQKERELVFASLQKPPSAESTPDGASTPDLFAGRRQLAQKSKLSKEELEVDASSNVTAALRRTHDLLSTELSRSRFAQETFDQSTAALSQLGEQYSNLDTILTNSRNLLGTLLRSQKSDTWYLETAFYILLATLCWLVFRRILLGPFVRLPLFILNWFIWKPLYLFLSLTGIIASSSAAASTRSVTATSSRPPLIVKPSAKGGLPKYSGNMADMPGVPAGAGGANAKKGPNAGYLQGEMSERIGEMAEKSGNQDELPQASDSKEDKEGVKRGDGTVLKERDETKEPRNPKKKVFEADVEDARHAEREQETQRRAQRDEL